MSHLLSYLPQRSNSYAKPASFISLNSIWAAGGADGTDVLTRTRADGRRANGRLDWRLIVADYHQFACSTRECVRHICEQNAYFAPFVPDADGTFSAPDRDVHR